MDNFDTNPGYPRVAVAAPPVPPRWRLSHVIAVAGTCRQSCSSKHLAPRSEGLSAHFTARRFYPSNELGWVQIVAAGTELSTYQAKRDFTQTAEPSGETSIVPSDRRRFVIQKHAATRLHYDLRLELDGVFKSWAVTRGPSLDPADKRLAVEVEDHPLDYGDFEGTIPKGQYGGGTVQLWDRGFWEPEGDRTPEEAFASGDLKFVLDGERLHGGWVLVRMKRDRFGGKRTNWLLIKQRDKFAQDGDGEAILAEDRSIASGRPMAEIAAVKGRGPRPFMLPAKNDPGCRLG